MDGYATRNIEVKSSKTFKFKSLLWVFIILIAATAIIRLNRQNFVNPVVESYALTVKEIKADSSKKIPTEKIKEKINAELKDTQGTYSIYFYDLLTGDSFGLNEDIVLTAASVNKVPILASLYYFAGKGVIDLEKTVTLQAKDIQDYGTGSIRYDKPGTNYSIKTLARLMMEKSDNTAAYLLGSGIIGLSEIQKLTDDWGMTQTDIVDNKSSVKDMSILLNKMYKGQITSPELTQEMLGFMDDSDFEDRITKNLPSSVATMHKTGDEVGKLHDVGIIDIPGRPYYLGVMTTDQTEAEATKNKIARISQVVFSEVTSL